MQKRIPYKDKGFGSDIYDILLEKEWEKENWGEDFLDEFFPFWELDDPFFGGGSEGGTPKYAGIKKLAKSDQYWRDVIDHIFMSVDPNVEFLSGGTLHDGKYHPLSRSVTYPAGRDVSPADSVSILTHELGHDNQYQNLFEFDLAEFLKHPFSTAKEPVNKIFLDSPNDFLNYRNHLYRLNNLPAFQIPHEWNAWDRGEDLMRNMGIPIPDSHKELRERGLQSYRFPFFGHSGPSESAAKKLREVEDWLKQTGRDKWQGDNWFSQFKWADRKLGLGDKFAKDIYEVPKGLHMPEEQPEIGGSHYKYMLRDEEGNSWMFKPQPRWLAEGEATASKIMQMLGVPGADVRAIEFGGDWGSVQKWLPNIGGDLIGINPTELRPQDIADLQNHQVIDWLISNHDSNPENLMFSNGRIHGIDKGQTMKHIGKDELSHTYEAPGNFGIPYYNTMWQEYLSGRLPVDFKTIDELLRNIGRIPDYEYAQMYSPYAKGRFDGSPSGVENFLSQVLNRKNQLPRDFEKFYQWLQNNRQASKKLGLRDAYA